MKKVVVHIFQKIHQPGLIFDIGGGSTELSCFNIKPYETLTKSISSMENKF